VRAFERLEPLLKSLGVVPESWERPNYRNAVKQVVPQASMMIYA